MSAVIDPDFRGTVLTPDDAEYDDARAVFNAMIDRKPELIMRCADAASVAAAIRTALAAERTISVYGRGHGVTGSAVVDGGV